jgi:hypothetical protein
LVSLSIGNDPLCPEDESTHTQSQLEAIATANKATIDAIMECMNAILGGGSGRTSKQNKENPPPATNATRGGNKEAKTVQRKKKC